MTMRKRKKYIRKEWTLKEVDYLRKNYTNTCTHILATQLNRTAKSIRDKANKCRLSKERIWKQSEIDILYKYYPTHSAPQIAEMLNRTERGVAGKAKRLGIKKRGKKQKVRKQQSGKNAKPVGTISKRLDKRSGKTYQYIKVEKHKWIPLARYVWIRHNGNIPPKHYIRFKDGDTLNCRIDNLVMLSYKEHAKLNVDHEKIATTKKRKKYNSFFESVLMGVV